MPSIWPMASRTPSSIPISISCFIASVDGKVENRS